MNINRITVVLGYGDANTYRVGSRGIACIKEVVEQVGENERRNFFNVYKAKRGELYLYTRISASCPIEIAYDEP